jgi:hypothetical protein
MVVIMASIVRMFVVILQTGGGRGSISVIKLEPLLRRLCIIIPGIVGMGVVMRGERSFF